MNLSTNKVDRRKLQKQRISKTVATVESETVFDLILSVYMRLFKIRSICKNYKILIWGLCIVEFYELQLLSQLVDNLVEFDMQKPTFGVDTNDFVDVASIIRCVIIFI